MAKETASESASLEAFAIDMTDHRRSQLEQALNEAAQAYLAGHYDEGRKLLEPVAGSVPGAASVRELYGLCLYRLGDYGPAARELEAFGQLTDSIEQAPVLADCYRAERRWDDVETACAPLAGADVSAELAIEGQIVRAGALADQGRLAEAIEVLRTRRVLPAKPQDHHLRRAYALGDLYERAGDLPRARQYFVAVERVDSSFVDIGSRVSDLG